MPEVIVTASTTSTKKERESQTDLFFCLPVIVYDVGL
jgi:hypothetical protein